MMKARTCITLTITALILSITITACESDKKQTDNTSPSVSTTTETTETKTADETTNIDMLNTQNTPKEQESEPKIEKGFLGKFKSYAGEKQPTVLAYIKDTNIIIYTEDNKKLQELHIDTKMDDATFENTVPGNLIYADVNFDSYSDFGILNSFEGNKKTYSMFFWDNTKEQYVYNEATSKIICPELIDNRHEIASHVEENATDFTDYTYSWNDDNLYISSTAQVIYNNEQNNFKITVTKYDEKGGVVSTQTRTSERPY